MHQGLPPFWPLVREALLPVPLGMASVFLHRSLFPYTTPALLSLLSHRLPWASPAPGTPSADPPGCCPGRTGHPSSGSRYDRPRLLERCRAPWVPAPWVLSHCRAYQAGRAVPRFLVFEARSLQGNPPPLPETGGLPRLPSTGIASFWI